jgi:hypothetical protein
MAGGELLWPDWMFTSIMGWSPNSVPLCPGVRFHGTESNVFACEAIVLMGLLKIRGYPGTRAYQRQTYQRIEWIVMRSSEVRVAVEEKWA